MKNHKSNYLLIVLLFFFSCTQGNDEKAALKTVVIIIDGLRKDYISESNTPNLYRLSQEGVDGLNSHSVFPSLTRVNSTSYATGNYPARHGILGNTIYLPKVDLIKGINTGDAKELMKADSLENGNLINTKTFGEWVEESGLADFTIYSTGTTGQSFLLNQRVKGRGIINPELILPASLRDEVIAKIGEIPNRERPNLPRHKWVTDAFINFDLKSDKSSISTIWYSDPDATAHGTGIGSEMTMAAIKSVDAQVGRILENVKSNGMGERFNIIISADHGFSTHIGEVSLDEFFIQKGLKLSKESDDVIVVGGGVYVKDKNSIQQIVETLQEEEWIGALFTEAKQEGQMIGKVPGTFSHDVVYWNNKERMADILVDVNWNDSINEFGYKGFSFNRGKAGHGSSSPFEMQTPFIAYGAAFRKQYANPLPTALIDIMPTVLHIHGIKTDGEVDGRVLAEILIGNTQEYKAPNQEIFEEGNTLATQTYNLKVFRSSWDGKAYFDYSKTERKRN
ncbi:alkaline phosphatase family protein [Belliella sp. R4-6]|uniref:Alkaline phosphatase family protein n=1 Tax=Belliella alkalica TaxID=1730871 RepID=A0ABS9V7T0_9BACT|nr:alkaline phosphatase family protein [Belliella alkalica]MCH7412015.1 alkaline phosphatase family protein [Belliella alkalica]